MKVLLVMVGKTTSGWLQKGIQEYLNRIDHYLAFEVLTLPDIKNTRKKQIEELKKEEGILILKQLLPGDRLVLLDESGQSLSSKGLAEFLEKQMQTGSRRLIFVIGGAYGFHSAVYQRADIKLSLSPMTFSHQMVRLIFAEQLYRAMTILKGEPYHHD